MFIFENRPVLEYVNDAAVKMLKYRDKVDIQGKLTVADFSPEVQPCGRTTFDMSMEMYGQMLKGEPAIAEYWHVDKEGQLFPVLVKTQVRCRGTLGCHKEELDCALDELPGAPCAPLIAALKQLPAPLRSQITGRN